MRVYVAGPYTNGDVQDNVDKAISIGESIWRHGHIPFIPHLFHYWHLQHPGNYEKWATLDIAWLLRCDAIYRIDGESPGADMEVAVARAHNMPVFYTMNGLCEWVETHPCE